MNMRGFTLIETVVLIGVTTLIMVAISTLYVSYGRMYLAQIGLIEVTLGANAIVNAAHDAALQANQIVASHAFSGTTYTSGTTTAIFRLPAVDSAGVVLTGLYDHVAISASGTSAYQFTDAVSGSARTTGTKQLTDVLGALAFTYNTTNLTQATSTYIDATTTTTAHSQTAEIHLRERLYLRNL